MLEFKTFNTHFVTANYTLELACVNYENVSQLKSNNEDKYDLGNEEYGYNGYKLVVSVRQKISEKGNSRDSFLKQISSIKIYI